MENENLIRLIEQTPDIRKRFKTEYISFGKPAGKPAIQTTYQTDVYKRQVCNVVEIRIHITIAIMELSMSKNIYSPIV